MIQTRDAVRYGAGVVFDDRGETCNCQRPRCALRSLGTGQALSTSGFVALIVS